MCELIKSITLRSLPPGYQNSFKGTHSFEKRKDEAQRIKSKYPDRIPVIVEMMKGSLAPMVDKNKYLVPMDLSLAQFMFVIRKRVKLDSQQAIFVFANGCPTEATASMGDIYDRQKDEDGFLYMTYATENTFG